MPLIVACEGVYRGHVQEAARTRSWQIAAKQRASELSQLDGRRDEAATRRIQAEGEKSRADIYDGARWAIKEGYADKGKIGVYGVGDSGYPALMEQVLNPDLYKFGISCVAITDIFLRQETQNGQNFADFDDLTKRHLPTKGARTRE